MRLLVSVRDMAEARIAARGGAGFIDLKEPNEGALGGLPPSVVRAIVTALRDDGIALPISATIGDHASDDIEAIVHVVDSIGACGVDYVKVGIDPSEASIGLLQALARSAWPVVPVFLADHGVDLDRVAQAAELGFPALMVDTAHKASGSLFDVMTMPALQAFVRNARAHGGLAGIAGALRHRHAPSIASLAPDFAGFRTAVCRGDRTGTLDAALLSALAHRMSYRVDGSECEDALPAAQHAYRSVDPSLAGKAA